MGKGFDRAVELDALELSKENDTITVADGVKMYKNVLYTLNLATWVNEGVLSPNALDNRVFPVICIFWH